MGHQFWLITVAGVAIGTGLCAPAEAGGIGQAGRGGYMCGENGYFGGCGPCYGGYTHAACGYGQGVYAAMPPLYPASYGWPGEGIFKSCLKYGPNTYAGYAPYPPLAYARYAPACVPSYALGNVYQPPVGSYSAGYGLTVGPQNATVHAAGYGTIFPSPTDPVTAEPSTAAPLAPTPPVPPATIIPTPFRP